MKKKIFNVLLAAVALFALGCDTDPEALTVESPYTYSPQYYANLRAYKNSPHQIFYGWFAAYSHREGVVAEYKKSASWGEHIAGLPDSLDICSLWMGIPSLKEDDSLTTYNPIAYREMREAMELRGIKMVVPEITRMQKYSWLTLDDAGIIAYGDYLLRMVFENDLDGLDLDYEPEGDWIQYGDSFIKLVQHLAEQLGPKSANPDKYLIIDYYTQLPPASVEPYINYLVNQAYTQNTTSSSATFLQGRYDLVKSWCPPSKFIVTENLGDWYENGGSPFTDAKGNTLRPNGLPMYSLEGFARWNPAEGVKGGWGGFYFDRDYNNFPPYGNVRRSIQITNPSIQN